MKISTPFYTIAWLVFAGFAGGLFFLIHEEDECRVQYADCKEESMLKNSDHNAYEQAKYICERKKLVCIKRVRWWEN